jgi:hypothetical protein
LAFLSFFNQQDRSGHHDPQQHGNHGIVACAHPADEQQQMSVAAPLPGAYVLPKFCEYCQASCTTKCPPHCTRPKLYFQKKRPPFCKRNPVLWNDDTDHAIPRDTSFYPISPRPHHHHHTDKNFNNNHKTTTPSSRKNIQHYHSRQQEVLSTNNNNAVLMLATSSANHATTVAANLENHPTDAAASSLSTAAAFFSPQQQQQRQQRRNSWLSMFATSAE